MRPKFRGIFPPIWALILGLESSLFFQSILWEIDQFWSVMLFIIDILDLNALVGTLVTVSHKNLRPQTKEWKKGPWCSTRWQKSFISPSLNAYCCWQRSCGKQFSTCQDLITGHYCWYRGILLLVPVFSGDHTFNLVCNVRKIPTTKTIMVCKRG